MYNCFIVQQIELCCLHLIIFIISHNHLSFHLTDEDFYRAKNS